MSLIFVFLTKKLPSLSIKGAGVVVVDVVVVVVAGVVVVDADVVVVVDVVDNAAVV